MQKFPIWMRNKLVFGLRSKLKPKTGMCPAGRVLQIGQKGRIVRSESGDPRPLPQPSWLWLAPLPLRANDVYEPDP